MLTLVLVPLFNINAQDVTSTTTNTNTKGRIPVRQIIREAREEIRDERSKARAEVRSTTTSAEKVKEIQERVKADIESKKAELKAEVQKIKNANKAIQVKRLDDKAQGRIARELGIISNKLNQRISRLSRVDSEITRKLNALALFSTTSAEAIASLRASQKVSADLLLKARVDLDAARTTILAETSTTTSKEVLRSLVKTVEASIATAAESYRKLFSAVSSAVRSERPISVRATTTSTTTR